VKPIAVSLDLLELHHLKNVLEAEGIGCRVRNELLTRLAGEIPFTECAAELYVLDERDRWRAEALLATIRATPPAAGPAWSCACGEQLDGQFTACWRCGATRPG
jgi:hypothetical protein